MHFHVNRKIADKKAVQIPIDGRTLQGDLAVPSAARGIVVFALGSGSGRLSPRNRYVARELQQAGLATLLMDLFTTEEEKLDDESAALSFDINLLATRLIEVTGWLARQQNTASLRISYFGASTGAAAALLAAAEIPDFVAAIVSRGGRPDLAKEALRRVLAPTLLIVGGKDWTVFQLNRKALAELRGEKRLEIAPGAGHLFEEPGALETVAHMAKNWFARYLCDTTGEVQAA
jgi:dienelactone hydrolase